MLLLVLLLLEVLLLLLHCSDVDVHVWWLCRRGCECAGAMEGAVKEKRGLTLAAEACGGRFGSVARKEVVVS